VHGSRPCPDGRSLHRVRDTLLAFEFLLSPDRVLKAATESRELDAGFRVVGRLHVTLKRLPPPPRWRGEALLHSSVAPLPPGGGGRRCFIPASPRCNSRLCQPRSSACGGSESGVDAARAGSQSLSWSLCRSHPSMATGRGRARAGRVNQASCGAVRHDCAALCHPQQRIDQRSAWRRRQSCQGPPGRAPSNPIH